MNNKKCSYFKLEEIFTISGSSKSYTATQVSGEGQYYYLTTKATLNGVQNKHNGFLNEGKAIVVDSATVGIATYQEKPFVASDHVEVLRIKDETVNLDWKIGLYIVTILRASMEKYGYGRKRSQTRLKNEIIKLPVKANSNIPDWVYMREYITKLSNQIVITPLDKLLKSPIIRETKYDYFTIAETFQVIKRGKRLRGIDRIEGNTTYVSASAFNNGVTDKISNPLFIEEKSIIYTTFGDVYYHHEEFTASDEITILKSSNMDQFSALYLVAIMKRLKSKYSFGRKAFYNKLKNEKLKLPVNSKGDIDWEYMSTSIKSMII